MENIFHSNTNQKNVGMMILISDKEDYRTKNITQDKEDPFIMIKYLIHQEYIINLNVYVPNNRASEDRNQTLIKWQQKIHKRL